MSPGIKTTELWVTIITILGSVLGVVQGMVPATSVWAVVLGAFAAAVAYVASRTSVKNNTPPKS